MATFDVPADGLSLCFDADAQTDQYLSLPMQPTLATVPTIPFPSEASGADCLLGFSLLSGCWR